MNELNVSMMPSEDQKKHELKITKPSKRQRQLQMFFFSYPEINLETYPPIEELCYYDYWESFKLHYDPTLWGNFGEKQSSVCVCVGVCFHRTVGNKEQQGYLSSLSLELSLVKKQFCGVSHFNYSPGKRKEDSSTAAVVGYSPLIL